MFDIDKYLIETRGYFLKDENQQSICNCYRYNRLNTFNWTSNPINNINVYNNLYEIRFKNGRKNIYKNEEGLFLKIGDLVAVEATTGHDIGIVSQFGEQIIFQINKYLKLQEILKIYRKAKSTDIEKWKQSVAREPYIFQKTKEIIANLSLEMKLNDVEMQGDGSKATFYYTAEDRVDFRELIKILASEFKIRIEMRQIGARQEAAKIGGIGSCGRELCCIHWKTQFESVTTNAARSQEISLNPSKLAGQCGKLKCCLNYEVDTYIEAKKDFPDTSTILKTKQGNAYLQKCDVFKRILWYSFDIDNAVNITPLTIERVYEIIDLNNKGILPDTLEYDNLESKHIISSKHNVKINENQIYTTNKNSDLNKKRNK